MNEVKEENDDRALSPNTPLANDLLIGVDEIANEMGLSARRAYHLCAGGILPAFKLGGRWHARKSSLIRFIEQQENQTTAHH